MTTSIDDGRAFLRKTDKDYDLRDGPDRLADAVLVDRQRAPRVVPVHERGVRGRQGPPEAGRRLRPLQLLLAAWLVDRLGGMLADTFGRPTIVSRYDGGEIGAVLANGPGLSGGLGVPPDAEVMPLGGRRGGRRTTGRSCTCSSRRSRPRSSSCSRWSCSLALVSVFAASRWVGVSIRRFSPHFFLLGAAFLLLETRELVSFGLLFGNTWVVNALVFFAILLSVLASIGVASVLPRRSPTPWYAALFVSLLISWIVPPSAVLIDPPWLRYALAAALAFAPVFFANLCFTYSFRDSPAGRHVVRVEPPGRGRRRRDRVRGADHRLPGARGDRRRALPRRVRRRRWLPRLADRDLAVSTPLVAPAAGP